MPRVALRLWLPVVTWAAVIFVLSSIPSLSSGLGAWDLLLRKAAHVVEFAILGALLARATGVVAAAFVLGVVYAATDEFHQEFVSGRNGNVLDIIIDAAGVAAGVVLYRRLRT